MKKAIVLLVVLLIGYQADAQSLEEGIKMYQYEKYESAKKILTPLASSNPKANYYLGLAELQTENIAAAKTIFSKYPEDPANMAGMARIAFAEGKTAEGMSQAEKVADKAKRKDWEELKYAADAITYSEKGDIDKAIEWYTKALEKENNAQLRIAIGDAYQKKQGGGGNAMTNYEKAAALDTNSSLSYSRQGALWYAAKNYELALKSYQKAKEVDPANPLPYRDLANAYYWTGKYQLAKENIEEYLKLSDKSTNDQIQYANILYQGKEYTAVVEKVNNLINSGITKVNFYGLLAYSQMNLKDSASHAKALENVRKYFSMQKKEKLFPADYVNYGKIAMLNGLIDSADYYFNLAVQKDTAKDKSETYRMAGESFKDAKDYAKSAEWYHKMITANPDASATDYFWRGAMYYYARDYAKADSAFRDMEIKYPDQPSGTYWRGRVAAAQDNEGKTCEGAVHYKKWLEMVGPDYDKKNDLMQAYQYLALCAYNQGNKTEMKTYMDKIESIEPENAFLKQLKELNKG